MPSLIGLTGRLAAITAFALLLAAPVWAQRGGGGHAGGFGGGHGGFGGGHFGGGHAGFGGAHFGRSFGGMRAAPHFNHAFSGRPFANNFSRSPFLHDGFRGNRFGNRFGKRFGRFRDRDWDRDDWRWNNCWGYNCGYGWDWPWWAAFWDSDNNSNQDYYDNLALAQQMNERSLEEQRMREQEEADRDQYAYARPQTPRQQQVQPPLRPQENKEATEIMPNTVLVYRDQHKQEIENYAIVGQTLWAVAPHQTQKIPLSQLDLPATEKANEDRGVTFSVPGSNQGQ